jgi:hypothetical protein
MSQKASDLVSKNVKIRVYKSIILSVVVYGCDTWWLILREGNRLRALENRMLRRIFGPKRDGVRGGWRKLHNVELHDSHYSQRVIRMIKSGRMRGTEHVTRIGRREMLIGYRWASQNERVK